VSALQRLKAQNFPGVIDCYKAMQPVRMLKVVRPDEAWINGLAPLPSGDEFHEDVTHCFRIERNDLPYLEQLNTPASSAGRA
jgi:hypothetical protein